MHKYVHTISYLTCMHIGSFCSPLDMGLYSREVPSKHTSSAILFYNNNVSRDGTQGPTGKASEQWALRT